MGNLRVSPIDTAMTTTVALTAMLAVNPVSTAVASVTTGQSLDKLVPLQEIASWWSEAMQNNANGLLVTDKIDFDTKAMRKVREGDTIVLNYAATTSNDLRLRGIIYLWFKE